MSVFSTTVDIDAPPARVWEVMSDVERWPEWTASVRRLTRKDAGPFGLGSRVRIEQPKLRPADWEVTSFEPGRTFTWVTRSVSLLATGTHSIEPAAGGTRATLSIRFEGLLAPVITWVARGLIERYLGLEAAGLKRRSEETARR
jgi:uncharacterized protein YndB with AHSA1/START domain